MPHRFPRSLRIADVIKREVSLILLAEVKDPRISGLVTVTHVDVSPDLALAKVFVSILGGKEDEKEVLRGLESARGFFRGLLAKRITMRRVPEIRFFIDHDLQERDHILRLLHKSSATNEAE